MIVLTDHASLTRVLAEKKPTAHVICHWECLMDYDLEIRHIPGVTNVLPDSLSRLFEEGESVQGLYTSIPLLHDLSYRLPPKMRLRLLNPPHQTLSRHLLLRHFLPPPLLPRILLMKNGFAR